jgi:dihydropteroate synthase
VNVRFLAAIEADDVRARYGSALSDGAARALARAADAHILAIDDALGDAASAALIGIGAVVVPAGASTLIAVSRAALERGVESASGDTRAFFDALVRAFDRAAAPAAALRARDRSLALDAEARVMGIVNVTPDSFYERVAGVEAAVAKTRKIVAAGAALVDVGGQSYAHWNPRIAPDEEAGRVVPVVQGIVAANLDVTISIDTFKAAVADAALDAGAHLINDCSGLSDPALPETVARHGAGLVVMHLKGTLMVREPDSYVYRDALAEIVDFLYERTERAVAEGVAREAIAVDPGLEFGKEPQTDLEILDRFAELRARGYPILFASSPKSFIGRVFDRPAQELLVPSLATAAIGIAAGARILRVHDVAETVQLARMMAAISPKQRAELAFAERMPGTPQAGNPNPPGAV